MLKEEKRKKKSSAAISRLGDPTEKNTTAAPHSTSSSASNLPWGRKSIQDGPAERLSARTNLSLVFAQVEGVEVDSVIMNDVVVAAAAAAAVSQTTD